uniref:Uncharacterized protein n=1 Tax=Aegilops tauschii subsp. strangulata TaxID=200361 RepID=A0A453CU14_AEGTS
GTLQGTLYYLVLCLSGVDAMWSCGLSSPHRLHLHMFISSCIDGGGEHRNNETA